MAKVQENPQVVKKILDVIKLIDNQEELSVIKKKKFKGSTPEMIKWLDKNCTNHRWKPYHFEYLEYEPKIELIEKDKKENKKIKKAEADTDNTNITNNTSNIDTTVVTDITINLQDGVPDLLKLSLNDRLNFLTSDGFTSLLQEMLEEKMKEKESGISKRKWNMPQALVSADTRVRSVKVNPDLWDRMVKVARKNGVLQQEAFNYAILEFLQAHE